MRRSFSLSSFVRSPFATPFPLSFPSPYLPLRYFVSFARGFSRRTSSRSRLRLDLACGSRFGSRVPRDGIENGYKTGARGGRGRGILSRWNIKVRGEFAEWPYFRVRIHASRIDTSRIEPLDSFSKTRRSRVRS